MIGLICLAGWLRRGAEHLNPEAHGIPSVAHVPAGPARDAMPGEVMDADRALDDDERDAFASALELVPAPCLRCARVDADYA